MNPKTTPINSIANIPPNLSDEEQIEFMENHGFSEEFWEQAEPVPEEEKPRTRFRGDEPAQVRLNDSTLRRLKALAKHRGVDYLVLLNDLLAQALDLEEQRDGMPPQDPEAGNSAPSESAEVHEPVKPRDWQSWAYSFAKENEGLLDDPDVDDITLSRLAQNSSSRLLELSDEIKSASARQGFPAVQMRRMMKGYQRLKSLTESAIELYRERFGDPEDADDDRPAGSKGTDYDVIAEAEKLLHGGP